MSDSRVDLQKGIQMWFKLTVCLVTVLLTLCLPAYLSAHGKKHQEPKPQVETVETAEPAEKIDSAAEIARRKAEAEIAIQKAKAERSMQKADAEIKALRSRSTIIVMGVLLIIGGLAVRYRPGRSLK